MPAWVDVVCRLHTGSLFQYKDCLSMYKDSHYKDKMIERPSYLYDENSHGGKFGNFHYKDKTVLRPSYLSDENSHTVRYGDFHYKDKTVMRSFLSL